MNNQQQALEFILKMRDEASSVLDKFGSNAEGASKDTDNFSKSAKKASDSIMGMNQSLHTVLIGFAALKTAFNSLMGATQIYAQFNDQLAKVNTIVQDTSRIKQYGDAIKEMASTTGLSMQVLTDGLYEVVSAFGDSENAVPLLNVAARAAVAGNASVADSFALLSAVLKGYGMEISEVQRVSDVMFKSNDIGQTSFSDMAASIGLVVPNAVAARVSLEEIGAGIATLTGVTGNAARVSTQLQNLFKRFLMPTEELRKVFKSLGFATGDAMVAQLGLKGAIDATAQEAKKQGVNLAQLMGDNEAFAAFATLAGVQAGKFGEALDAMGASAGATERAFNFAMESMMVNLRRIGNDLARLFMPIGEALEKPVAKIANALGEIVTVFDSLTPAAREAVGQLSIFLVTATALGPVLAALKVVVPALTEGFADMGRIALVASRGVIALGLALFTTPIGWITLGLLTLMVVLNQFGKSWTDQGKAIGSAIRGIGDILGWLLDWGTRILLGLGSVMVNFGKEVWASFKNLGANIMNFINSVGQAWDAVMNKDFSGAAEKMKQAFSWNSDDEFDFAGNLQKDFDKIANDKSLFTNLAKGLENTGKQVAKDGASAGADFAGGFAEGMGIQLPKSMEEAMSGAGVFDMKKYNDLLKMRNPELAGGSGKHTSLEDLLGPVDNNQGKDEKADKKAATELKKREAQRQKDLESLDKYLFDAREKEDARYADELTAYTRLINDKETLAVTFNGNREQMDKHFAGMRERIELQHQENLTSIQEKFERDRENAERRAKENRLKSMSGMQRGIEAYRQTLEDNQKQGKQWAELTERGFRSTEDALVDFVKTGKLSLSSLFDTIVDGLVRIAVQQAIMQPLTTFLGGMGSTSTGGSNTASWAASAAQFAMMFAAKGAVVGGGVKMFAQGGVVDSPMAFPMKNGMGIAGEAGPEGILPLKRSSSGDLGVQVVNGAGGGVSNVSLTVNVAMPEGANDQTNAQRYGQEIGRQIRVAVVEEMRRQSRVGGMLNPV